MQKRLALVLVILGVSAALSAQEPPITVNRTPISFDGNVSAEEWQGATRFDTWFETNVGDNVEPSVKTTGWLTYDDRFLYAAFDMEDPDPRQIAGVLGDHDEIKGISDDFAGIILDTRGDARSAIEFFVNAAGVHFDATTSDTGGGEDPAPDFFWDSAVRRTERGWQMEMRVPFSSLRYEGSAPPPWRIILFRNRPRDRREQYFTHRLPRGSNCFICNFNTIAGFTGLPSGGNITAAPYVTARALTEPNDSGRMVTSPIEGNGGLDVKWTPTMDTALDATINPDFSQIESDTAAISTNERFAIFFPEKRPFFLEGVDLFSTPLRAVHTRTITSPRWGLRSTGSHGETAYTLLIAQDRGGGTAIIPSALSSEFADQDFLSTAVIGRVRHGFGKQSFASFLVTTRESDGAHNRVFGPDFQYTWGKGFKLRGQYLVSDTRTPNRPELADEWDGRKLRSYNGNLILTHNTSKTDVYLETWDSGDDFRDDNGFFPQVGYRGTFGEYGYTWRPTGFFNRIRGFGFAEYQAMQNGAMLYRLGSLGFGADGKWRSFWRLRVARDAVRSGDDIFERDRIYATFEVSPSQKITRLTFDGWIGDEVDFEENRLGQGASISSTATLRPTRHLQVQLTNALRWLNVRPESRRDDYDRLFTAHVERIRATYTFNPRMFVRTIVQNTRSNRDRALFSDPGDQHAGGLASQLLFAYKLNWQTVLYVGAGDIRDVDVDNGDFEPSSREIFMKVSYAFQR